MALTHKTSDIITVKPDVDHEGNLVLELSFRFVRYRLVLDNMAKAQEVANVLQHQLSPQRKDPGEPVTLPRFYKNKGAAR